MTNEQNYLGSQDTFYLGTLKGVGRIYQQTFIDTYTRVAVEHEEHALKRAEEFRLRVG